MGWAESNASRRGLLGQLAGQFTEMAKMKQAKRQNTQDILAGYGQQALGVLGQQQLETQRQTGESALAGEKHGYQLEEDISRITTQSKADEAYLEKQIKEMYAQQPKWEQEAQLERVKSEYGWAKSQDPSLTVKEFLLGYAPVAGGKDEMDEMQKALSDPVGWASTMMYMYMQKEGIDPFVTQGLPEEHRDSFLKYGTDFVDIQFPKMGEFDKNRLKAAIQNSIREQPEPAPAPVGGTGLPGFTSQQEEMAKVQKEVLPALREKLKGLPRGDPLREIINRLLSEVMVPTAMSLSSEKWEDWKRRAQQVLHPTKSLLELRRGASGGETTLPSQNIFERLRKMLPGQ